MLVEVVVISDAARTCGTVMPRTTTVLLTPMTPDAVMSAFNYLRAVEAGDTEAASEFTAPSRPRCF